MWHGDFRAGSLAIDADDVAHADLQVGVLQVVLADVHVAHRRLLQRLGEACPGCDADLKILAHVQRPHALVGQDLGQVLQLRVPHTLLHIRQLVSFSETLKPTQDCTSPFVWHLRVLLNSLLGSYGDEGRGLTRSTADYLYDAVELHGLVTSGAWQLSQKAHPLKVLDVKDLNARVGSQGVQYGVDVGRAHIRGDVLLQAQHAPVRLECARVGSDQGAQPCHLLVLHARHRPREQMSAFQPAFSG